MRLKTPRYIGLGLSLMGVLSFLNGGSVISGAVLGSPAISKGMWYGAGVILFLTGLLILLFSE